MAKLIYGERVGKLGQLMVSSCAVIFDQTKQRLLLTRRTDNGRWCLPGGAVDAGESAAEACSREVWEETGLKVEVGKLIGIYTNPHCLMEYADGNRFQLISFSFEVEVVGGTLGLSDETTEYGYYLLEEIRGLDLMEHHRERVEDAFANQDAAFVR